MRIFLLRQKKSSVCNIIFEICKNSNHSELKISQSFHGEQVAFCTIQNSRSTFQCVLSKRAIK